MEKIRHYQKIIEESKNITVGDKILVNHRARKIEVIEERDYYKNDYEIQKFYILEGDTSKYLLIIYKKSVPILYTESNFSLKNPDWADGFDFTTEPNSSEKIRSLFIDSEDFCSDCETTKLFDSNRDSYYCPLCEV